MTAAARLPVILQDSLGNNYVYGLDLISRTDSAGVQEYYLSDGLGSTANLADGAGNVTASYGYDVFGELRSGPLGASDRLFTGEQRDGDSGLYYLRARYYDPSIGRFLSEDPLPGGNLYAYVGNNPVNFVDPLGLCGWTDPWDCVEDAGECVANDFDCVTDPILEAAEAIAPYALQCAIWGGSAFFVTFGNPTAGAAGCATGVVSEIVHQVVNDPFVDCLVWGAGGFAVARIAAKQAVRAVAGRNAGIAGCVSGAGSWLLNEVGLSNPGTQCGNWAIPGGLATFLATKNAWDALRALAGGCAGGLADALRPAPAGRGKE